MKSIKHIVCCFAALCLITASGLAQDKIIRRSGEVIECKVIRIGSEFIIYKSADPGISAEFEIEKKKVEKIIFENGTEYDIDYLEEARESTESNSADLFLVQNTKAIKWNFTSTFAGVTEIGYEKARKPGQSFEANLGIIGLGFNFWGESSDAKLPFGIGFKVGYKFMRSPDFYMRKMRYSHVLKGAYVKPEIAFATYSGGSVPDWMEDLSSNDATKGAFLITFGKQTVFTDKFLVDFFFSIGIGFTNQEDIIDLTPYYFSTGTDGYPLAFSSGMRIGLLF